MTDEETPEVDPIQPVIISKQDLIPEKTESIVKSDTVQQITKEFISALQTDGVQMVLKGITQKYLSTGAEVSHSQRPQLSQDEKMQIFVNGMKHLFEVVGEKKTLKDGLDYIPKNLDKFKEVL